MKCKRMNLIGKDVAVVKLCMDGNAPTKADQQYIGRALNRVVKIIHQFANGFYLTDFFMPEFINDKNDYCHYGFLILDHHNFRKVL